MSFFVVAGTVKPFRVAPVELVDYLLGKIIYFFINNFTKKTFATFRTYRNKIHALLGIIIIIQAI